MGFSLKAFFASLEFELANGSIFTVVPRIRRLIESQRKYAEECGQLE